MEIQGTVSAILEAKTGTSEKGEWKSQSFVIEIQRDGGRYTSHMAFEVFGADKVTEMLTPLSVGQQVKVYYDVDAHEYEGKWYNSVRAWKIEVFVPQRPVQSMYPPQQGYAQYRGYQQPPQGYMPQGGYPPQQGYAPQGYQPPLQPQDDMPF